MSTFSLRGLKIGILYGGRSGEHEVSLLSAASVLRHIPARPEDIVLIGIDQAGRWFLQGTRLVVAVRQGAPLSIDQSVEVIALPGKGLAIPSPTGEINELGIDIVFPVLHGTFGEDGTIQGFLEMIGLPYVGSGVLGSSLGMDKEKVKRVWQHAGLPIVPFTIISKEDHKPGGFEGVWKSASQQFGESLFVKPARCGSSVGINRADNADEFKAALTEAFRYDTKVLIEPAVDAREIEISVTGNGRPRAYVAGEITPTHEFYDYEAKYLDPDGAALIVPAELSPEQMTAVKDYACRAYATAEARGLARVDFFLDRKSGQFLLNEINTLPGFTHISMFPRMCQADGLSYENLITHLIELGLEEAASRNSLRFSR